MTYTVSYKKTIHGNRAETAVSLGHIQYNDTGRGLVPAERVLKLSTSKGSSRRITSFASVCVEFDNGHYTSQIFEAFGDFTQRCTASSDKAATEKEIRRVHDLALLELPQIVEAAKAFYVKKDAA